MIDKTVFKEIKNLKKECEDLEARIKIEENTVLTDSVKGSSTEYPYIQHNCVIEGIQDSRKYKKYKRILKNKKRDLEKKLINFEYQLNYVEDSDMRMLLRLKYVDGLTNFQIAHEMNKDKNKEYTEDGVRMKIKRFLQNN